MEYRQRQQLAIMLIVSRAWELYPHMRFGELVSGVLDVDPNEVEDEETLRLFSQFVDRAKDV